MKQYLLINGNKIISTSDMEEVLYRKLSEDHDILFLDDVISMIENLEANNTVFLSKEQKMELKENGFENMNDVLWNIYIHWLLYWT